jgi:NADH dehydrogenase FAD-containing subunit
VVSLPRLEGRRIGGIPHDEAGFVAVDRHCRVVGMERVFAAGDVTSFPIKQGGIAAQQADAAAEAIAAAAGAEVEPASFDPVLEPPPWGSPDGKIVSRYLSPFLDAIADEDGTALTLRDH